MTAAHRLRYLRIALVLVGLACLALYPLMILWPSGWAWHMGHSSYQVMIVGIYATLGVFLILAARDPLEAAQQRRPPVAQTARSCHRSMVGSSLPRDLLEPNR
jgi:hypothetical protein